MSLYEPINHPITTEESVHCCFMIGERRLTEILGAPLNGQYSARRDDDVIVVWRGLTEGWHVWANTNEAWKRFKRELILPTRKRGEGLPGHYFRPDPEPRSR